ncbi:MAG: cupin-like domain-containing protein [bacterium]
MHESENPQADTTSSAFLKAVIEEGQMLFLPMLWWYQVHTNPEG